MLSTTAHEIKERAGRINLSVKGLAHDARLDPATFYRAIRGQGENLPRSVKALTDALIKRELNLLKHLVALHPEEAATALRMSPSQAEARHG